MLIVADTSALLALAACDSLELLTGIFGEVRVLSAVHRECVVAGKFRAKALARFLAGKVVEATPERIAPSRGIGPGEAEAKALYAQLGADWLLIDDGHARRVASRRGIRIVGSLGVLLTAKSEGRLPALRPLIDAVRAQGIHFSEGLVSEVLRLAGEE